MGKFPFPSPLAVSKCILGVLGGREITLSTVISVNIYVNIYKLDVLKINVSCASEFLVVVTLHHKAQGLKGLKIYGYSECEKLSQAVHLWFEIRPYFLLAIEKVAIVY